MKLFQQSLLICIAATIGCVSHVPQLIYRYWSPTFNPSARNGWFLLQLIYLPILGCSFQEAFMRTGNKKWAKIGLSVYSFSLILSFYMIIFGGAVATNSMFPDFSIGYEKCNKQNILAQWAAFFHLIGLGIELSAQSCAVMLLIQCLRFSPEMVNYLIIEERARTLIKLKEEEEKEEEGEEEGNKETRNVIYLNGNEHDLSIYDIAEEYEERFREEKSWNIKDGFNFGKEKRIKECFVEKSSEKEDDKKGDSFVKNMMFNGKAVRPYEVEGIKNATFRDEGATMENLEESKEMQASVRKFHRTPAPHSSLKNDTWNRSFDQINASNENQGLIIKKCLTGVEEE